MKKNKITVFNGHASFVSKTPNFRRKSRRHRRKPWTATNSSLPRFQTEHGSQVEIDKTRIITSTEALKLTEVPKHLLLIGGGVIGIELGSVYARLGSKVSVVEFTDAIIGTMDRSLGQGTAKNQQKTGL